MNELNPNQTDDYKSPVDATPVDANPVNAEPIDASTIHEQYINQEPASPPPQQNATTSNEGTFNIPNDVKLKQCKYCRVLIPKDAKICPNCKKKIKRGKIKTFFLSIFLLALTVVLAFGIYYYRYTIQDSFTDLVHAANNRKPSSTTAEVPTTPPTIEPMVEASAQPSVTPAATTSPAADTKELPKIGAYKDYEKEDFIPLCTEPDYKEILRTPDNYKGLYVKMNLRILDIIKGTLFDENTYYLCIDTSSTATEKYYLLRDVRTSDTTKLLTDDNITVYGQFFSLCDVEVSSLNKTIEMPAVDLVFSDLVK
ncbi:hypothetical protein lbkm_4207 [Lachnospiraceae bacterium KM106-2]|nr:hypothetical protein lbkm_4207 [Lachnospiraceae bacterium KM106-2]